MFAGDDPLIAAACGCLDFVFKAFIAVDDVWVACLFGLISLSADELVNA